MQAARLRRGRNDEEACVPDFPWPRTSTNDVPNWPPRYWWLVRVFFAVIVTLSAWHLFHLFPIVAPPDPRDSFTIIEDPVVSYQVSPPPENEGSALEGILKDASMQDKTVILTTLNEAWAAPDSVFDLFLGSFKTNTPCLLKHLVVGCFDQQAQSRCQEVHSQCFDFTTGIDFSEEAVFNTEKYLEMMWKRIELLRSILQMGYNFLFTDADIMWFRDPFHHFDRDADFQIASDVFIGNPCDRSNLPNGGFKFVRPNNRTIQFYDFWIASRKKYPNLHDQDVLNKIKFDPKITEIGLKMKFLDTTYFGGFCQVSKDLNKVCTMHANCCVGSEDKLHDLRLLLEDWNRYKSMQKGWKPNPNGSSPWRVPNKCTAPLPSPDAHVPETSSRRHGRHGAL